MILSLTWTVPSPTALPFTACFRILASLCFWVQSQTCLSLSLESTPLSSPCQQCLEGQVRSLTLMVWNPFTEQDGGGPVSLPLSSSCSVPLSPSVSSESSELLNDPSMTPPCTPHLRAQAQGAGTIFSNPNQRKGARFVNEPFLQRGWELTSLSEAASSQNKSWLPGAMISRCVVDSAHQCTALADIRRCECAGRGRPGGSWLGSLEQST